MKAPEFEVSVSNVTAVEDSLGLLVVNQTNECVSSTSDRIKCRLEESRSTFRAGLRRSPRQKCGGSDQRECRIHSHAALWFHRLLIPGRRRGSPAAFPAAMTERYREWILPVSWRSDT